MAHSPFSACSPFPVLARIPLLSAADSRETVPGADSLLAEGMFLASRQVDSEADLPGRDRSRMAITRRSYEIRAQLRPVPHMVFAGVTLARFAGQGDTPSLRLGGGHRARTNPSAAWLAAVRDQILTDPAALSALTLTTSNLVTRHGPRLEQERPASGDARPQHVSVRTTEATTLPDTTKQPWQRPVPNHPQIIDRVRASHHARHDRRDLHPRARRATPRRNGKPNPPVGNPLQARALGQP